MSLLGPRSDRPTKTARSWVLSHIEESHIVKLCNSTQLKKWHIGCSHKSEIKLVVEDQVMKQAFGSGDRGEFSGSTRFESKDADFSDDILSQISNMPIGIHAASNQNRRMEVMGEFILVQAILREAIRTYQKYAVKKGTRASRLFRDVNEWFSSDDRRWFFSFVNVCDTLGLEPTYIRTGLKLWRERKLQTNGESPAAPVYQSVARNSRRRLAVNELRS